MKTWTTLIRAVDPKDGEIKLWMGPYIPGEDKQEAIKYCQSNGLGYCQVDMEFVGEVDDPPKLSKN